jgi:hypothetical protein
MRLAVRILLSLAVLAFIAWWTIPQFGPSRIHANESAAIGAARDLISAQVSYSSASQGSYGDLKCLRAPWECLPDYPRAVGPIISEELTEERRRGYKRRLYLGPAPAARYAYTLVPEELYETGVRSFCADEQGEIWILKDGTLPDIVDARCPPNLTPLR